MKCPQCGQWNRASLPRCQKCGAPLAQDGAALPEWRTALRDDGAGTPGSIGRIADTS